MEEEAEVIDSRHTVKAGKKTRKKKELPMPEEERKEKCRKRVGNFWVKMSPEEKDQDRESDTKSRQERRAKMSPEEKDQAKDQDS